MKKNAVTAKELGEKLHLGTLTPMVTRMEAIDSFQFAYEEYKQLMMMLKQLNEKLKQRSI